MAGSETLLVVDDEPGTRLAYGHILTRHGYDVWEAENGDEALRLAASTPDLILLDVNLPDLSGFEVCERLRDDPVTRPIPVLFISAAFVDAQDRVHGMTVGGDGYLTKPVEPSELVAYVGALLRARKAERALREREARFAALLNKSFDGILLLDRDGMITYASESVTRIMGYATSEFVGRHFSELVPPEDLSEHADRHARIVSEPGLSVPSCNRYRHKDGSWRWLEVHSTNLLDDPNVHSKVVNFRDVTEQRRLEEQYRQAQKMEAIGRLAGGVAHDFNNLLTVINGYSELVQSLLPPQHELRSSVQAISEAGARAAALTRQLLAFSRQSMLAPRILDLNAAVAETETLLRRLLGEDVTLTCTLARDLSSVRVDPGQLSQVLMNLAVNARDAMPSGGRITIETKNVTLDETYGARADVQPGAYVLLAVSDTGEGMSPEVKARIFEPFFTTKGPAQGTGLGLAMVHGIVKQSGGHIEVYSEPGVGTTFKVYLPAVDGPAMPAPETTPKENLRGTETVLLVEDEAGVRSLAFLGLRTHGYTVLQAANGPEALRLLEKHGGPVDILLSDVVMPEMGGRQLAKALLKRFPAMKVLYLSGYTEDAVIRHGVLEAQVAFLQKPFTPLTLLRKLRQVLDCARPADSSK